MTAISRAHRVDKGTVDLTKGLSLWDVDLNAALALQPLTLGKSLPLSELRVKARPSDCAENPVVWQLLARGACL